MPLFPRRRLRCQMPTNLVVTLAAGLVATLVAAPGAWAANASFATEASFAAAAGATFIEGFESTPARLRGTASITTPSFVVTSPNATPIGINNAPDSPNNGFGAFATQGSSYLTVYQPGASQGTIVLTLNAPTKSFGFNIIDLGEATDATLVLATNVGAFQAGVTLATYTLPLANGNVQFYGITQDVAFTQVFITANGNDDAYGLDQVYLSAVPELGTAPLLLVGIAALGLARTRRRA